MNLADVREQAGTWGRWRSATPHALASVARPSAVTLDTALDLIDESVTTNTRRHLCVAHLSAVTEAGADCDCLRVIWSTAALVLDAAACDAWWNRVGKWISGPRVTGRTLLVACCERSVAAGYRHCLVGPGLEAEGVAARLQRSFPGLAMERVGPAGGGCEGAGVDVARRVNGCAADIVWVGLDTPQQERWIARYAHRVAAPVVVALGGGFDGVARIPNRDGHGVSSRWLLRAEP